MSTANIKPITAELLAKQCMYATNVRWSHHSTTKGERRIDHHIIKSIRKRIRGKIIHVIATSTGETPLNI